MRVLRGFPAQLSPEFEELQVSVMGLHGVFKIEKGIEKTGGLHEALGLSPFVFLKRSWLVMMSQT